MLVVIALLAWVLAALGETAPAGRRRKKPPRGETVEVKPTRQRRPARRRNDRPARWLRLRFQIMMRLSRRRSLSPEQLVSEAERELDELYPEVDDPVFEAHWKALRPRFSTPKANTVVESMAIAAAFRLPAVRWLAGLLETSIRGAKTNKAGRKVQRGRTVAALLWMCWHRGKPSAYHAYQRVFVERNETLKLTFDWPQGSQASYKGFLKSLHGVCRRHDPVICRHLTVEFARQLSRVPTRRGKGVRPYGVCEVLIVDATGIEANLEQRPFVPDRPGGSVNRSRHADEVRGRRNARVTVLTYLNENNEVRYKLVGWKWLMLSCAVLNRPVIAKLVKAADSTHERRQTIELLRELFEWWPEAPVEFLIGDALYAQDHTFIAELWRNWGIYIVAPVPENQVSPPTRKDRPTIAGVPVCLCRRAHDNGHPIEPTDRPVFMVPYSWDEPWGPRQRAKAGLKRGTPCPHATFRIRWRCPNHRKQGLKVTHRGCGDDQTFAEDHWAFNQFLPLGGGHSRTKLRAAMLLARNRVESNFAALKRRGIGNKHTERAEWADEHELEWVLGLGTLWLLLGPVIYTPAAATPDPGAGGPSVYRLVVETAAELGLLDADDDTPIDEDHRAWARARVDAILGPSRPPATLDVNGKPRDPKLRAAIDNLEQHLAAIENLDDNDDWNTDGLDPT